MAHIKYIIFLNFRHDTPKERGRSRRSRLLLRGQSGTNGAWHWEPPVHRSWTIQRQPLWDQCAVCQRRCLKGRLMEIMMVMMALKRMMMMLRMIWWWWHQSIMEGLVDHCGGAVMMVMMIILYPVAGPSLRAGCEWTCHQEAENSWSPSDCYPHQTSVACQRQVKRCCNKVIVMTL